MGGRAAVVLSGIVQYLNQLNVQLPEAADGKMLNSPSCSTSSLLDPVWAVQTAVQLRRYHNILLLPKNILHCDCQPSHDYQMKPLMASFHESKALCSLLTFVSPHRCHPTWRSRHFPGVRKMHFVAQLSEQFTKQLRQAPEEFVGPS